MAKQTVIVSDLSGEVIEDGKLVNIRVTNGNTVGVLDASRDEELVQTLLSVAITQKRRGRRPKN